MISMHPGFLTFMLLLGLTLMVTVLFIDYANTSKECRDPTILSASRIVLVLGSLLFASTATLLYVILLTDCGYSEGQWNLAYTIFVIVIGLLLIVAGSIISIKGKQVKCPIAVKWSPIIWGIGTLMIVFTASTLIWGRIGKQKDLTSLKEKLQHERSAASSASERADAREERQRTLQHIKDAKQARKESERRSVAGSRKKGGSRSSTADTRSPSERGRSADAMGRYSSSLNVGSRPTSPDILKTTQGSQYGDLSGPNPFSFRPTTSSRKSN